LRHFLPGSAMHHLSPLPYALLEVVVLRHGRLRRSIGAVSETSRRRRDATQDGTMEIRVAPRCGVALTSDETMGKRHRAAR
jgi:hypothetical protein